MKIWSELTIWLKPMAQLPWQPACGRFRSLNTIWSSSHICTCITIATRCHFQQHNHLSNQALLLSVAAVPSYAKRFKLFQSIALALQLSLMTPKQSTQFSIYALELQLESRELTSQQHCMTLITKWL